MVIKNPIKQHFEQLPDGIFQASNTRYKTSMKVKELKKLLDTLSISGPCSTSCAPQYVRKLLSLSACSRFTFLYSCVPIPGARPKTKKPPTLSDTNTHKRNKKGVPFPISSIYNFFLIYLVMAITKGSLCLTWMLILNLRFA